MGACVATRQKNRGESGDEHAGLSFAPLNDFAGGEWSGKKMFTGTPVFRFWLAS
jgi:hypothetical protein